MAAAALCVVLVGCANQPSPPQRPNPAELPGATADLDVSGALTGHVSEVRIGEGYLGPGTYSATALLRDLVVLSSATLHGAHAWGANQIVLWPMRSDQSGPASYPRPDDSAMVHGVGSWSCSAASQPASQ